MSYDDYADGGAEFNPPASPTVSQQGFWAAINNTIAAAQNILLANQQRRMDQSSQPPPDPGSFRRNGGAPLSLASPVTLILIGVFGLLLWKLAK